MRSRLKDHIAWPFSSAKPHGHSESQRARQRMVRRLPPVNSYLEPCSTLLIILQPLLSVVLLSRRWMLQEPVTVNALAYHLEPINTYHGEPLC